METVTGCRNPSTAPRRLVHLLRGPPTDPWWARPGWLLLLAATTFAYTWAFDASGYGNEYYAAAAYSGSQSWTAWLFGSFDAASFISVDKPPLSLWVIGLSVRLFGLSSWSVLLPQAMAGVATVAILHGTVRRWRGPAAGLTAGAAMALTPVAVVMFRYDNPDAVLVLLLVAALAVAWSATRRGSGWRLAAAGSLVGLAFLTKTTQALLVVPGIAVVYLATAPVSPWGRLAHGLGAAVAAIATAGWWILLAELSPAAPYFGQTSTGSFVDYILGVNGLDRISGDGAPAPDPFGGTGGWGRLFNEQVAGQASWLMPLAVAGLIVAVWRLRRRDPAVGAGWLLWGTVFATHFVAFSLVDGVFHPYYTLSMAPAIAALAGAGAVELWDAYRERHPSWWVLPAGVLVTGWWAVVVLGRTPDFLSWLRPTIAVVAVAAAALLVAGRAGVGLSRRVRPLLAVAVVGVAVAGPLSYAVASVGIDYSGGDPKAGPTEVRWSAPLGSPEGLPTGPPLADRTAPPPRLRADDPPSAAGPPARGAPAGNRPAPPRAVAVTDRLVAYLAAHHDGETWLVATVGTRIAARLILVTGEPVMAMGGFSGGDPTPTEEELAAYLEAGELRFVLAAPGQDLRRWRGVVNRMCDPVGPQDGLGAGFVLYDCAG